MGLYICYLSVFLQKCRHCLRVKILDRLNDSDLWAFSYKIYLSFSFPYKEVSFCFMDLYIRYLQVLVQKHQHCVLDKILNRSNLGVFSYKIWAIFLFIIYLFFFLKYFQFVSRTFIYVVNKFSCKKHRHYISVRVVDWSNLGALSYEIYHSFFFFFFLNNFSFLSWTFIYAIYKFSHKISILPLCSKFLTGQTCGHSRTKFTQVFYFLLKRISHLFLGLLYICYLLVFMQKGQNCIFVKSLDWSDLVAICLKFTWV